MVTQLLLEIHNNYKPYKVNNSSTKEKPWMPDENEEQISTDVKPVCTPYNQ